MLVGFDILDATTGSKVGTVAAVDDTTVNLLFELEDGRLIPASDDLISDIDMKQGEIRMNIPEGLLEL